MNAKVIKLMKLKYREEGNKCTNEREKILKEKKRTRESKYIFIINMV